MSQICWVHRVSPEDTNLARAEQKKMMDIRTQGDNLRETMCRGKESFRTEERVPWKWKGLLFFYEVPAALWNMMLRVSFLMSFA